MFLLANKIKMIGIAMHSFTIFAFFLLYKLFLD